MITKFRDADKHHYASMSYMSKSVKIEVVYSTDTSTFSI